MSRILVTGSAGFIGFHLCKRLLEEGHIVTGIDNVNPYYDPELKQARLTILRDFARYTEIAEAVEEPGLLAGIFSDFSPELVVHLAAQAGVRYSIDAPRDYLQSNLIGTFELLEAARANPPAHMLLASTSSAYGANTVMPYVETVRADHQMSFYAATKKATESMAHSYAHLYDLPITMFRFFTVYGPWGRPDMAPMKFARRILAGDPIDIYNHGKMQRDFTYIDDLIEGICRLSDAIPRRDQPVDGDSLSPVAPYRVVNIGAGSPEKLMDFIAALEQAIGKPALKNFMDMQPGDVPATWADTALLTNLIGPTKTTPMATGVATFVQWYRRYHNT